MEGSFHPADVDCFAAAAASTPPRYPSWALVERKAYFADRVNGTTAQATSRTGRIVKVTFCLADPPAVSHFCVHGPEFNPEHFAVEPRVISSEKDLVLLGFAFNGVSGSTVQDRHAEYFIYKAGRGNPSLKPIPATPPGIRNSWYVGIALCDDGEEGGFFLADLTATTTIANYNLSIFSSKMEKWVTRTLQVQAPTSRLRVEDLFIAPHKVIALGGGMVGWVDLWRGIIVCNIREEDPFIYFIPLPKPHSNLPRNGDPKPIRDVACHNSFLKFVELDHCFRPEVDTVNNNPSKRSKVTKDDHSADKMYDLDILFPPDEDFIDVLGQRINCIPDGWEIRTCYRHLSWDHWRKVQNIHVDDILVNNPKHSVLPQLWGGYEKSRLRNLTTAYPTLHPNGEDVVYLMSNLDVYDKNTWMVGVHLGKKSVEILEPYAAQRAGCIKPDCLPCGFSEFLNTAPRSFAVEPVFKLNEAQKRVLHDHLSSGYRYSNRQHQSPLLSNLPQPLNLNLTSPGSGHVYPVNSQSMCPVLKADANGQLWLSVPLVGTLLSQLLEQADHSFTTPMPQMPVPIVQPTSVLASVMSTLPGKQATPAVKPYRGTPIDISRALGKPAAPAMQPDRGPPNVIKPREMQGESSKQLDMNASVEWLYGNYSLGTQNSFKRATSV